MYQRFFSNTELSKYIKNLLQNTPLPIYKTVKEFDLIIENNYYIFRNHVIKCTKTGYIAQNTTGMVGYVCDEAIVSDDLILGNDGMPTAKWDTIEYYRFGQFYPNISSRFHSINSYYDSDTHEHLGKYLETLRDLIHIDLMGLYNCFSYRSIKNIYFDYNNRKLIQYKDIDLTDETQVSNFNYYSNTYKTYIVPIHFNRTYTMALDCAETFSLTPIFYNVQSGLMTINNESHISDGTFIKNYSSFKEPFTFTVYTDNSKNENFEKYLYLLIQIPNNNNSSIVILEDSHVINCETIFNHENIDDLTVQQLNQILTTNLSLLDINDHFTYPFSDRLIEYLFDNVITYQDSIGEDIERIQYYITDTTKENNWIKDINGVEYMPYKSIIDKGVFDNRLRVALYDLYTSREDSYNRDITGWVDTVIEKYITKGFDV